MKLEKLHEETSHSDRQLATRLVGAKLLKLKPETRVNVEWRRARRSGGRGRREEHTATPSATLRNYITNRISSTAYHQEWPRQEECKVRMSNTVFREFHPRDSKLPSNVVVSDDNDCSDNVFASDPLMVRAYSAEAVDYDKGRCKSIIVC
ncbi:hypothetical protein J6590_045415 [Homalodisca vitripennis]|nr:hypothetical protein J6590_045415 [Homalodisca vitripennis]